MVSILVAYPGRGDGEHAGWSGGAWFPVGGEEVPVPEGHDYRGPPEALTRYRAVVAAASSEVEIKGATNPYTSRNGHMFSFLTADGTMALRLSEELGEQFRAEYESGPVEQYGSVMRGYVSIPADLLDRPAELAPWFDEAWDWIGSLPPKPTKR